MIERDMDGKQHTRPGCFVVSMPQLNALLPSPVYAGDPGAAASVGDTPQTSTSETMAGKGHRRGGAAQSAAARGPAAAAEGVRIFLPAAGGAAHRAPVYIYFFARIIEHQYPSTAPKLVPRRHGATEAGANGARQGRTGFYRIDTP